MMNDPCKTCTRCKEPLYCGSTTCPDWRAYFVQAWDTARLRLLELLTEKEAGDDLR